MKEWLWVVMLVLVGVMWWGLNRGVENGAPPYVVEDLEPPPEDEYAWLRNWKRPDGPVRVGLQAGHWKNDELPEELNRLIGNTGASGGGKAEWEVNLKIAELTAEELRKEGVEVDILPATIPANYWADVFVAIHADGSTDRGVRGYKLTAPRRDFSGSAEKLAERVRETYGKATGLNWDDNITRNMKGYYAFAWWRYEHAVHPKTASIIVETGFLSNVNDRKVIVGGPEKSASGIGQGVLEFLRGEGLM